MHTQRVSVRELKEHWKAFDKLAVGQGLEAIPLNLMPPWDEICSELNWQSYLLEGGYFAQKHHGYCGVYRLVALASESELNPPATLNRVCGQDRSGTLYIGCTIRLSDRLNQLRRSLLSRYERSHSAITMLRSIPILDFAPNKLAIALLYTGKRPSFVESYLIKAYMNTFGDTPPLNYRL